MESCIKQNNAIEIYQDYFNEIDESTDCEEPKAKVGHVLTFDRALSPHIVFSDCEPVP